MTVKFASLAVDLKKEAEGDWIDSTEIPGVRLHVRSLQSPAYSVALDLMRQKHRRVYQDKPVPNDIFARDFGKLAADHLLLGWAGFDMDYPASGAHEYLTDPTYRVLLNATIQAASEVGRAKIEFLEDASKN